MNDLKTIGRVSASGIFKVSLILIAVLLPAVLVFGTSTHLKSTLRGSGIYSSAVDQALDSATKNADKNNSLPFDQPEVQAAVKKAIPPQQIQAWVEQMIDGTYGWLNSNDTNPVIKLDFASTKQNLANNLGDYAVTRAKSLPLCTTAQLQALQASGGDIDAFTADCIPRGFDVLSLRAKVQEEVLKNSDILDKSTFTAADFPKNDQGKTVFQQAERGRTAYKLSKMAPSILIGIALVSAGALLLLHDKRRRGAFVVGRTLVVIGTFTVISAVVLRYLITQVSSPTGPLVKNVQGDFQSTVVYVVRSLGNSVNDIFLKVGLVYLVVGGAVLLVLRLTKPKSAEPVVNGEPEAGNEKEAVAVPETGSEIASSEDETTDNKEK